jgi:basic membrane protein A
MPAPPALAQDALRPAIMFSEGTRLDGGFNEIAYRGMLMAAGEFGLRFREYFPSTDGTSQDARIGALSNFAKLGADPIVVVGFTNFTATKLVAERFPERHFAAIDGILPGPNVRSVVFRDEEGALLMGVAAALSSRSGTIGFIGALDIPVIRRFECGYVQGARLALPEVRIKRSMIGTTGDAFRDLDGGRRVARAQIEEGADVLFPAAGGAGLAVIDEARLAGKLAIGVDTNQNGVASGTVLTSMVKRVDVAVLRILTLARSGRLDGGIDRLGLADGAIDWVVDEHNFPLLTRAVFDRVRQTKKDVVDGRLKVHNAEIDGPCP